jgi:ferric-dicitrate binding protein FerR (iron transport regulator)
MNEEVDIILSRYFSGEATPKELHTLDMWLSSSDENEKYFHQMSQLYQYAGQTEESPAFNTEKALAQFKFYMSIKNNKKIFFKTSNLWRAAAAVALLAITTFALFYFLQPSKTIQLMATDTQKEFILFENAEVTLFPGTEIVYNKSSNHQVQLKGKATFTIQSEETKKLIVQAGETYIEDIGTIFTVDATAPDKSITVEVTEGEVWFYTENNTGIYLSANESAVYNSQTKQFIKIEKPSVLIEALPVHEIVFHDTPLIEAIEMIKARYNVDIIISSKTLNEILLNASFDNSESVEYMLEIITATISAQLVKKNETYVIAL